MKVRINEEAVSPKLRFRVRLDFRAEARSGRFFFGGQSSQSMAESIRDQQVNLLKNVPLQGISIDDFDTSISIYFVSEGEDRKNKEAAYAPLIITLKANQIEDVLPLIFRPECRKIEVLGPESLNLDKIQLERLLYTVCKYFSQDKIV